MVPHNTEMYQKEGSLKIVLHRCFAPLSLLPQAESHPLLTFFCGKPEVLLEERNNTYIRTVSSKVLLTYVLVYSFPSLRVWGKNQVYYACFFAQTAHKL